MDIYLNLLIDILSEKYTLKYFGKRIETPLLRPVFYDPTRPIEDGRIYLSKPDTLPQKHVLNNNILFICAEGTPSLAFGHSGLPLLVIQDASVLSISNEILDIFERFDKWERSLDTILDNSADISELIRQTAPLVMNDITVVDRELYVIAFYNFKRDKNGKPIPVKDVQQYDTMKTQQIVKYKKEMEENRKKIEPFFSVDGCYCINLFLDDYYFGCLSLYPQLSPLRSSDSYIIFVLAKYILKALNLNSNNPPHKTNHQAKLVSKLLEGEFLSDGKYAELHGDYQGRDRFLCLCFTILDNSPGLPANYICDKLRKHFNGLLILNYDGYIVGVQDFSNNSYDDTYNELLRQDLNNFNLRVGVSNRFDDLRKVRFYFLQAKSALEVGTSLNESCRIFHISDQALHYLMLNSVGIFPAEYICPQELLRLREYDITHEVDYWATLRCYLDFQMNIADSAKFLKIHRNTLVQRVEKINKIFGSKLQNSPYRLWLRISIYLFDQEATTI